MAILSTSTLTRDAVVNPQGEDLGHIKDFVIDTENGRVAYAVLSFGGLWGLGDKLFALPMDALTVDTQRKRFVTNIRKDQLKEAPGFDQNNWPNMSNLTFIDSLYTHYGYEPYSKRNVVVA